MADWQSYLNLVRKEDTPLPSLHRLLTTTTTTTTATEADTVPPAPDSGEPLLSVEMAASMETCEQNE